MGRLVVFDSVVQEKINEITTDKDVHTGLIIGQSTPQKDIVVRLCPTPYKDDDEEDDNPDGDGDQADKNDAPDEDLDLDDKWICLHAKQVSRALPGGLDILGLYVACPTIYATRNQDQISDIIFAIFKIVSRSYSQKLTFISPDKLLLNICTATSNCICQTYDISDPKPIPNMAEWKLLSSIPRFHRVECQLAVDLKFPIRSENSGMSLQRQIESGLKPFFKSISIAQPLINGVHQDLDEILDGTHESKKTKKTSKEQTPQDHVPQRLFCVELFIPVEQNNNILKPDVFDCVCMMTFKGLVQNRAFIHSRGTVKEAVDALKQDIIRSISARCEIHCEDLLLIDEEQQGLSYSHLNCSINRSLLKRERPVEDWDPLVIHELPRRVFALLPQTDLSVCDYQFHGDSAVDSLDAFKELFDMDITQEDVDTSCEQSPTTSTLILPEVMDDRLSDFGGDNNNDNSPRNMIVPMAGAAIAVVAAGVSYFLLLHNPTDK